MRWPAVIGRDLVNPVYLAVLRDAWTALNIRGALYGLTSLSVSEMTTMELLFKFANPICLWSIAMLLTLAEVTRFEDPVLVP